MNIQSKNANKEFMVMYNSNWTHYGPGEMLLWRQYDPAETPRRYKLEYVAFISDDTGKERVINYKLYNIYLKIINNETI